MPEVSIEVAGRSYRVGCGEGEEVHLVRLAELVDTEATKLARKLGQMPEGRLMLMCALMMADQISDAEAAKEAAERKAANAEKLAEARQSAEVFGADREAQVSKSLDALAVRIETLASRVEEAV